MNVNKQKGFLNNEKKNSLMNYMFITCTCDKGISKYQRIFKHFVYMIVHISIIENVQIKERGA